MSAPAAIGYMENSHPCTTLGTELMHSFFMKESTHLLLTRACMSHWISTEWSNFIVNRVSILQVEEDPVNLMSSL